MENTSQSLLMVLLGRRQGQSARLPQTQYYDDEGRRVHEEHPRSTLTWKQNGIRHDTENSCIRLSKGANHKEHPKAWEYILVEYETRPGVTVENLQQVRAVYDQQKEWWELHFVCRDEIETPTAPGDETAGIDLGISNFAAVAYSTEDADLYPGNCLKVNYPTLLTRR